MDRTIRTDDELLSAFIDGELPDDEAHALAGRLAAEPQLAQRLAALRSNDDAVRSVYEALDDIPLPDGVTRLLDVETGTGKADSNVVTFPRRGLQRLFSAPVAMAAAIALVAGFLALRQVDVGPDASPVDALVAGSIDGDVREFLETGVSGQPEVLDAAARMQILLSFEGPDGNYCRQLYVAATDRSVHGVACREVAGWQLEAVAPGAPPAPDGQFQAAATATPEAVVSAVDRLIGDREPLSTDEENVLISESWKKLQD